MQLQCEYRNRKKVKWVKRKRAHILTDCTVIEVVIGGDDLRV